MNFQDMCGCNGFCNPEMNENPDFPSTCADKPFPFSSEELEIFDYLLSIRKEVNELKRQLAKLEARGSEESEGDRGRNSGNDSETAAGHAHTGNRGSSHKSNGEASRAAHALEEKINCEARISALRHQWNEWKKKSEEAAIRRMIALGHIEPGDTLG